MLYELTPQHVDIKIFQTFHEYPRKNLWRFVGDTTMYVASMFQEYHLRWWWSAENISNKSFLKHSQKNIPGTFSEDHSRTFSEEHSKNILKTFYSEPGNRSSCNSTVPTPILEIVITQWHCQSRSISLLRCGGLGMPM